MNACKSSILFKAILLGALFILSSCIQLDPSPLDTSQGELLGWAAIATTPDPAPAAAPTTPAPTPVPKDPQVRYTNNTISGKPITATSIYLSTDASCKGVLAGTTITSLASPGTSAYITIPAGTYWVFSNAASCAATICSKATFTFAADLTYTLDVDVCNGAITNTSP